MSARKCQRLLPLVAHALANPDTLPLRELSTGLPALGHQLFQRQSCSTSSSHDTGKGLAVHDMEEKLRQLHPIIQLQRDLKHEAELHDRIPYTKLLKMIYSRGAARSEKEAQDVSEALQMTGVAVRHNGMVYLRPGEIADKLMPDFPQVKELEAKLNEINALLAPLEQAHYEADRVTMRLLYGGYFVLAVQLVAFYYLTYFELSWDVMEPAAYILSLVYSIVGYTYFLGTKGHVFELKQFQDSAYSYFKGKKLKRFTDAELDEERYQHLLKVRTLYLKRLEAARSIEASKASSS